MRVKIGEQWFDSSEVAICVQVSEREQAQIANMDRAIATEGKFASFPDGFGTVDQMFEFMRG